MRKPTAASRLSALLASLSTLTRSCNDVRHCSRCGLPLTDPASWERGQGPICAHKDTVIYAKTIMANFTMATAHAMSVKPELLPSDVAPVWSALRDVLFDKSEHAISSSSSDAFTFSFSGEDCRLIAKVIDWMLSFRMASDMKFNLIQIVKFLGFVGLAGVLSGKSSTGDAELKFDAALGVLSLTGSSNKAGFTVMRRIPGITFPRYRGQGAYTAPASQHPAFIAACMEFWPCFNGEVDSITEQCKAWLAVHPPVVAAASRLAIAPRTVTVSSKPVATVTNRSTDFTIAFPWISGVTMRLVEEIKTIPRAARSYDPATKIWSIRADHKAQVISLLSGAYDVVEVQGGETPAAKPTASRPAYRPYHRAYFRR